MSDSARRAIAQPDAGGAPEPAAVRLRIDLAYDGTRFRGWAAQPGLRTVQGVVEDALSRVLRGAQAPRLVVAGRTDAGVHARGQVAHLDLDASLWERHWATLAHRVRGVLGTDADVAIRGIHPAPAGFDARFSPVWRRYEYRVADGPASFDPLERHRTTSVRGELDEGAMDAAARSLIGLHDFAAYCKPREGATTIRTLLEFDWHRDDSGVLVANVKADAFCHSMVRALVGACVAVGAGRLDVARVAALRDAGERTSAFPVLAAKGLTLVEVGYPADELLAVRATQTRARRGDDRTPD